MTNPIPVARLGRFAVDRFPRGQRIGDALFRDDAKRILHAADTLGIRDMIVHAISEDARVFYLALGFASSPGPMTFMATLAELRTSV